MDTKSPEFKEIVIEFLSNPFDNRSFDQFCKDVDIAVSTFWLYRKSHEDELGRAVEARKGQTLARMRSAAYKALLNRLSKSDNAIKLYFQLVGDLVERTETSVKYTEEEKRERIATMLEKLSAKLPPKTKPSSPPDSVVNTKHLKPGTEAQEGERGEG